MRSSPLALHIVLHRNYVQQTFLGYAYIPTDMPETYTLYTSALMNTLI